ncbi:alpha/beta hydrolase family protein [Tellurirhabdus rosea]|uniref:alpha/beta hydrolase family protein n=1 Tax=Tellurirhabdus rosea TaxID=2674997 RepID=UPI0022521AC3|nr:acetylxylan esterase [Tellurirhabdus rosea]
MKTRILIGLGLLLMTGAAAQTAPELCQGAYFTEAQGKAFLEKQASAYTTLADWKKRAGEIRAQIRRGAELESLPPRPTSKPILHSRRVLDGYTVENVAFESLPGIYVTGNLYRPLNRKGKVPGVICPHGHGGNLDNRLMEYTQKRCASLARMGAVVFAYDMVGYGDQKPISQHKLSKAFKLQAINSLRSLDFLLSLPEVDTRRVAVTGESGGGTQTFMLTALDPRVTLAVPTVMVSAYFFGGCACESGMPVHKRGEYQTNNVEIAALAAPRPMLLISDGGDWTKNTPEVEFPHVQRIYGFYGKKDQVEFAHFPDEKHDYGPSKRAAMYRFIGKHFNLDTSKVFGPDGQLDESGATVLTPAQLTVFTAEFPRPANARVGDEAVMAAVDFK